jgi:hypothetical protein
VLNFMYVNMTSGSKELSERHPGLKISVNKAMWGTALSRFLLIFLGAREGEDTSIAVFTNSTDPLSGTLLLVNFVFCSLNRLCHQIRIACKDMRYMI